jgi:alginate O-acetyltransferase complex protein AlgI
VLLPPLAVVELAPIGGSPEPDIEYRMGSDTGGTGGHVAFNSISFLLVFLPLFLLVYFVARTRALRNWVLVLASLGFYIFGGARGVAALLASILFNYVMGLAIDAARAREARLARGMLALGVLGNVAILGYFKYSRFVVTVLDRVLAGGIAAPSVLTITGVSFFTFLGISYLVDVYRERAPVARRVGDLALYMTEFPALLAGPIARWEQFAPQVRDRQESIPAFATGVERFIIGFAKKAILAGGLAALNSDVFANSASTLAVTDAWLGAIGYTLQIYFDFSGYSDMAIGLALMVGIKLPENFAWPYAATSVTDFWRRWHMSLSRWFREYVYIPLGGNRVKPWRLVLNLLLVWGLTGLWHGAGWVFIAWGLYFGLLLAFEKLVLGDRIERIWMPLRHLAVAVIVISGWVIFSAPGVHAALARLQVMFGLAGAPLMSSRTVFLLLQYRFELLFGAVLSLPIASGARDLLARRPLGQTLRPVLTGARPVAFAALLLLAIAFLVNTTFQPFIYFGF